MARQSEEAELGENARARFRGDGSVKLGAWFHIQGGYLAEVVASAGFDWYCIDRQHGLIDDAAMLSMLQVLNARSCPVAVRVSGHAPDEIGRALDWGADAIIVPMINSASEARKVADARLFPPRGTRSWGPSRAKLYPPLLAAGSQDETVACLAMVETRQGLAELEDILAIDGIDGIFMGPSDLLLSLGGDEDALEEATRAIREACNTTAKIPGVFAGGSESAKRWIEKGFELVAVDSDSSMLAGAARMALEQVKDAPGRG